MAGKFNLGVDKAALDSMGVRMGLNRNQKQFDRRMNRIREAAEYGKTLPDEDMKMLKMALRKRKMEAGRGR